MKPTQTINLRWIVTQQNPRVQFFEVPPLSHQSQQWVRHPDPAVGWIRDPLLRGQTPVAEMSAPSLQGGGGAAGRCSLQGCTLCSEHLQTLLCCRCCAAMQLGVHRSSGTGMGNIGPISSDPWLRSPGSRELLPALWPHELARPALGRLRLGFNYSTDEAAA